MRENTVAEPLSPPAVFTTHAHDPEQCGACRHVADYFFAGGTRAGAAKERAARRASDAQVALDRDLVERLAPDQPMNQDEQGGCVWCGGPSGISRKRGSYAGSDPSDHYSDCPWVAARVALATPAPLDQP